MRNFVQRRVCLKTIAIACLMALGALTAPVTAHAQGSSWPGRIEILPVRSQTLPLDAFLRGEKAGPEVLLGGELRLPVGAGGRVPAVILIHGSGGIGAGLDMWAHILNEAGIAAFILDIDPRNHCRPAAAPPTRSGLPGLRPVRLQAAGSPRLRGRPARRTPRVEGLQLSRRGRLRSRSGTAGWFGLPPRRRSDQAVRHARRSPKKCR